MARGSGSPAEHGYLEHSSVTSCALVDENPRRMKHVGAEDDGAVTIGLLPTNHYQYEWTRIVIFFLGRSTHARDPIYLVGDVVAYYSLKGEGLTTRKANE